MPRPPLTPALPWMLLALSCGAVSPPALHAALAAVAGSLFEAAPFVLAAEVLGGRPLARIIPGLGCGCGRRGFPGALSLPATAIAWLTFGPAIAAGRFCAALAVAVGARRRNLTEPHETAAAERPDALAELAAIAPAALAAALAAQALAGAPWLSPPDARLVPVIFVAGLALGILVPCATAAVAIAASLAHALPPAAAGLLCSAGFVTPPRFHRARSTRRGAGFASIVLALALAMLALRGPSGFVNPRLTACLAVAALVAAAGARRRTTVTRYAALLPGAMLAALATGSPAPPYRADATTLTNGFPGERVDFTGVSTTARGATTLERFAITCCRIDAAAVAVRLTIPLALPNGSWVSASGPLVRAADGSLALRPANWRRIPAPKDPFTYL